MKYSEVKLGRIFIVRLEDGEILHEVIEKFAEKKKITGAFIAAVGCADKDSKLVVGPEKSRSVPANPMDILLDDVYEIAGVGTIFPNSQDKPILHMHISCGRKKKSVTGCVRRGVKVWHVMEIIIWELKNSTARRVFEKSTGFELMQPCADL